MSMTTFKTGEVPICPYCELKHVSDALAQSEGERKRQLKRIQIELSRITHTPLNNYEAVREMEHRLDDYATVLREARHKIEGSNPRKYLPHGLTDCEKRYPSVKAALSSCIKQTEKRKGAFVKFNPVAVCRASVKCPPK